MGRTTNFIEEERGREGNREKKMNREREKDELYFVDDTRREKNAMGKGNGEKGERTTFMLKLLVALLRRWN